jgi:hypothetical protein
MYGMTTSFAVPDHWTGAKTVQDPLTGGSIVIH